MKAASEIMHTLHALHDKAGPDTVARIELLEGVRGILASWVMLGHFLLFLAIPPALSINSPWLVLKTFGILGNGIAPVSLFMIISGFVISHLILVRRENYKAYITRRFLRLFPAFACCLAAGVMISPLQSTLRDLPWGSYPWLTHQAALADLHQKFAVANILLHLTMLHGLVSRHWVPDATGAFIGVGWSIATEWQFYLVAPFLLALVKKFRGLVLLSLLLVCLSPEFPVIRLLDIFVNESTSFLLFHLNLFFVGGVSYYLWRKWRAYLASPGAVRPQGLVLCGLVVAFSIPDLTMGVWVFLFTCLCQIAALPNGIESRVVQAVGSSGPALFIGRISYSIYLAHWPVSIVLIHCAAKYLYGRVPTYALWGIFALVGGMVTIGVATLLYYFVEAPAIRWGKKLFKEDKGPAPMDQRA